MHPEPHDELRVASFRDLDTTTLYAILRLRVDVFVVEQECPYPELDGRDTEPGTRHLWFERGGEVRAYLRVLRDPDAERIGRVVTAKDARGAGLAGRLITEALTVIGNRPAVLHAQAHLADYYATFGFAPSGPEYLEDGIPHIPMAKPA
ncbi:putative GCN5-related N-acetyltransferase [Actinoplanes missouriensis 431]|uniref:Putative GCN5-related N-acetyltransferase n=1 Tax=Actinoplanes missouriensis (strain ATCC 14538 / DSM 43046 / CBS 188.64 / JCM 3121 / NBRC 102363 / NCIMB 12654 / NRRL B-3342 / UNCC 431) TaxID=512565 RepID=I0HGB0_ACTM4|nr:GNAT family N-acetyltransferase [Actinoplanes missouriensis]BAL92047.1 putative GCN5-related N-acetyltransferase [Actinoplanes missouriensis 431]